MSVSIGALNSNFRFFTLARQPAILLHTSGNCFIETHTVRSRPENKPESGLVAAPQSKAHRVGLQQRIMRSAGLAYRRR